jgi:hypothetical protein
VYIIIGQVQYLYVSGYTCDLLIFFPKKILLLIHSIKNWQLMKCDGSKCLLFFSLLCQCLAELVKMLR